MKPPYCNICDNYHYGTDHIWGDAPTEDVAPVKKKVTRPKIRKAVPSPESSGEKFDRKAYQRKYMREYMRKRRKKERGE